jgi:multidrug resistance efflux pump
MAESLHPAATHHLPSFITPPGDTDVLMVIMAIVLLLSILGFGILFLRLHTLPERMAQKAGAEAELDQAQADLRRTVIRAGVNGRVEQFVLRVGDVVNPLMRPAGVLIPEGAGERFLQAGFDQIEAQIMKPGMIAEVTCVSKPWTVIPMVVTSVQDYIAAGQFKGGEQLLDVQQVTRPGTLLVFLEPLYKGGLDAVTPGSSCVANAYSDNHDEIVAKDTGALRALVLHVVDALALVHALILRLQALVLPFQNLVFSGH